MCVSDCISRLHRRKVDAQSCLTKVNFLLMFHTQEHLLVNQFWTIHFLFHYKTESLSGYSKGSHQLSSEVLEQTIIFLISIIINHKTFNSSFQTFKHEVGTSIISFSYLFPNCIIGKIVLCEQLWSILLT